MNGGRTAAGNIGQIQNPLNFKDEKGVTVDNIKQRFVNSLVYELPWGKGKPIGSNLNSVADKILGGWTVSAITTFRSGFWLDPRVNNTNNCNSASNNFCRPDLVGNPYLDSNGVDSPMFDINAFNWPRKTAPFAAPRYGTAGVNILEGNGINNWDMALLKNIAWAERYRIQFRWELFNAFNHTSFGQPNPNRDAGAAFGRVTGVAVNPREMQFGMKFYW